MAKTSQRRKGARVKYSAHNVQTTFKLTHWRFPVGIVLIVYEQRAAFPAQQLKHFSTRSNL